MIKLTDQQWIEGYYESEGTCVKWNQSWKTCTTDTFWETYENTMLLNSTTLLWEMCPDTQ